MHETDKDICNEENKEYELDFYIRILEALIRIYDDSRKKE
ncbi:hypothetical protein HMPREF1982_03853 [Clostridiales bacterium oral taxon 876 str. F0540]|nr:hypothetical protein HMPREF1982_03853 [Clostridiales bacterium oral taxon 876 str. F0540]